MAGPPSANSPSSARPNGSGWMRALGFGCGFVAFGGLCIVGLSSRMIMAQANGAASAASGFLADVRDDDYASALQRMDASYQRDFDAAHLQGEVHRITALEEHVTALLTSTEAHDEGERVTVEGSLYGPSGEVPVAFELAEDGGYWYVQLVVVDGTPIE